MTLSMFLPALIGGLISASAAWFVFTRTLVTRAEVEAMVDRAMGPVHARQAKNENTVDNLREDIIKLREAVVKLTTVLEQLAK